MLLSSAQFIHYLLCTDIARVDFVQALVRGEPPQDAHKDVREAIVDILRLGLNPLDAASYGGTEGPPENIPSPAIIAGFQSFVRTLERAAWFEPPLTRYSIGPVTVEADPEIGLTIENVPHVIKLYLSRDPLPAGRRTMTLAIMDAALSRTWPGVTFGVLDVRRGRLHTHPDRTSGIHAKLTTLMRAEALGLHELWSEIRGQEIEKAKLEMEALA